MSRSDIRYNLHLINEIGNAAYPIIEVRGQCLPRQGETISASIDRDAAYSKVHEIFEVTRINHPLDLRINCRNTEGNLRDIYSPEVYAKIIPNSPINR